MLCIRYSLFNILDISGILVQNIYINKLDWELKTI